MLNKCINTKSVEFQTNLKRSGLSEFDYAVMVRRYFDQQRRMGISEDELRYPELDMVDGADSSQYLSDNIKLKKDNSASIEDILSYAKTEDIQQANVEINNKHRDLEVSILPLNKDALVTIEHRPTDFSDKERPRNQISKDKLALLPIFDKLANLYGIKFNNVTLADLQHDPKFKGVYDAKHTNAFILNGEIYINMDVANADAPIHEMTHLLLGSIKYQNPEMYSTLVDISEQLPMYQELAKNYPNRTRSDVNEEIFVTELAKFLANQTSVIQELPEFVQHDIIYNVKRMLDSMLMGDVSVKMIPTERLLSSSIFDIAEVVNSDVFHNTSRGILQGSSIHRILNNRKSDLMNRNELKEHCE
jgi:hypothetical protein